MHLTHVHPVRQETPLWELVTKEFPLYETYQRRPKRVIPIFVLEEKHATFIRSLLQHVPSRATLKPPPF